MAADSRLTTIRTQLLDQIENLTLAPKPEYWIDGQRVLWEQYLERLEKSLDWVDRKIAEGDWTEVTTIGLTTP
jgi:hypothetical protein